MREVKSLADLRGRKFRIAGLGGAVMQKMGVASLAQLVHLAERLGERTERMADSPADGVGDD